MSVFVRTRPAETETRSVRIPAYYVTGNRDLTTAGVRVDADTALRHSAVWSCIQGISQDVAMMPVDVVRYVGSARQPVTPTPQIVAAPSAYVEAMDWREQVVKSWLTEGNAWGLVTQTTPDVRYPTRIELVNPSSVRCQHLDGKIRFYVNQVEHDLWPIGDLWHRPAYTVPGSILGLSPIRYHALTIGIGLAAEEFGAGFFGEGGHPSAILSTEGDPGPDGAKAIKESWSRATKGSREPAVLPASIKYTPIQVNPTDSQFLDTMRYSVEEVCRIFREDPADHASSGGGSGSLVYANRSDTDLAKFKRRQYWVTKLQNAISDCVPRPQFARLNTAATLMMTTRERYETHAIALSGGWRSINEVRELEDEEPIPGGDFGPAGSVSDDPTPDSADPEGGPT